MLFSFNKHFILEKFQIYRNTVEILKSFYITHTQFPLLLSSYISMVRLLQLMNIYWHNINWSVSFIQFPFIFTQYPFSLPWCHSGYHVTFSNLGLLGLLLVVSLSPTFLLFDDLENSEEYSQIFCSVSPIEMCLIFFHD